MDEHTDYSGRYAHRSCCVVGSPECKAPPAFADSYTRGTCFACGQPVCTDSGCSSRVQWYYHGIKRVCRNCQTDHRRTSKPEPRRARGE